ncbi:hypothetical protein M8J77_011821 [Diaphorina citri]|nr:hypothetical protein M8J77_011821 [Diaphorina citri]
MYRLNIIKYESWVCRRIHLTGFLDPKPANTSGSPVEETGPEKTSGGSSTSSSGLASAGVTPPASPSTSKTSASSSGGTRVTLRLNQNQLKTRASHDEPGGLGGKKCKVNLPSSSGAYSSAESVDGGSDASGSTSKVKMENMEEILLKENTSAIETNTSQVSN